jgi:hypothetical protein
MSETDSGQTRAEFEADLIAKSWQDDKFKQDLIADPKAVFEQKLGNKAPADLKITVLEENPKQIYLVLPVKPQLEETEELSDEALNAIAGGKFGFISVRSGKDVYYIIAW